MNSLYIDLFGKTDEKDKLANVLDGVIENIQISAVSEVLKNKEGSGDPEGGSIEYKRFANATLQDKGTARASKEGTALKAKPVIVNLNDDKEIIEELQTKDLKLYGIAGMAEKRMQNFTKRVIAYLDKAFFAKAIAVGTAYTGTSTNAQDIIDDMIVTAKSTESDFIDGIDSEDLAIVLSNKYRKELKNALDELPNGTDATNGIIGMYDGIEVFETHRLPKGTNAIVMLKGSIAQPYFISEYDLEKIPLDDSFALQTFLYTGVEALAEEAIIYNKDVTSL